MARRRLGYLPDLPDPRDLPLRLSLIGGPQPSATPPACSLRGLVRQVFDQKSTSSCVAQAFAQAIVVAEHHLGVELEPPSRLAIYANSRKQHSGVLLSDDGTYLRTAATGLQKLGAPPESAWPFATSFLKVNRMPPFSSYMAGIARRGGGYYRVVGTDNDRIRQVKAAIVAGTPVTFGTQVSTGFLDASGPTIIDRPKTGEPLGGGHAQVIVGYETTQDGSTLFEVCNSWGTSWRDRGFCKLTDEYLCWSRTQDLWCVAGWAAVQQKVEDQS